LRLVKKQDATAVSFIAFPWARTAGTTIVGDGLTQTRYFQKKKDAEKPHGEWNKIEIIAEGGRCRHVVNGVLVNEATDASLSKGKIVLQSEGAEVFYRKVELHTL